MLKICIVLPPNLPAGGNWTYSGRLQRGLRSFGIEITRKPLDRIEPADIERSDIIHAYNAYLTGRHIVRMMEDRTRPLVLTMTGTDVNEHLANPALRTSMCAAIERADRIVFLTDAARQNLAAVWPQAAAKSHVVNLGVDLPTASRTGRASFGIGQDEFVFLLPAGIRSVKRPLDALEPLARVHARYPKVRFMIAGAVLDCALYEQVEQALARHRFARHLGEIPHVDMAELYRCADVVMNTSSSEGLSHALLEAMSLGRPVLASHVPGNRDIILEGENGYLYRDADDLVQKASLLYTDERARARIGAGAKRTVESLYCRQRELEAFHRLYVSVSERRAA